MAIGQQRYFSFLECLPVSGRSRVEVGGRRLRPRLRPSQSRIGLHAPYPSPVNGALGSKPILGGRCHPRRLASPSSHR